MKTNDIKKGMRVRLNNGWYGTMMDNQRGNTRLVEVEGFCTEIGSVYAFDIARVETVAGVWEAVELTDKQQAFRLQMKEMGFA